MTAPEKLPHWITMGSADPTHDPDNTAGRRFVQLSADFDVVSAQPGADAFRAQRPSYLPELMLDADAHILQAPLTIAGTAGFMDAILNGGSGQFTLEQTQPEPGYSYFAGAPVQGYHRELPIGDIHSITAAFFDPNPVALEPMAQTTGDEPEFFLDEAPNDLGWHLIADSDRITWNLWCDAVRETFAAYLAGELPADSDYPPLPAGAKRLEAHPRWTVFKQPRQKFS